MDELSGRTPPLCTVEITSQGAGTVVVMLAGELDLTTIPDVESRVEPALALKPSRLIVDIAGVHFADSSAIAMWVRWRNATEAFELRDPSQSISRVIRAMGLSKRLGVAR